VLCRASFGQFACDSQEKQMTERVNKEIKRRTRVATLFPNEASLLRLTIAVLVEITEEWETGKRYLNMETD